MSAKIIHIKITEELYSQIYQHIIHKIYNDFKGNQCHSGI